MKRTLLREKPYTVTENNTKYKSFKISLHGMCGFAKWERVYQVRREDGVVELIPERAFNPEEYRIKEKE